MAQNQSQTIKGVLAADLGNRVQQFVAAGATRIECALKEDGTWTITAIL